MKPRSVNPFCIKQLLVAASITSVAYAADGRQMSGAATQNWQDALNWNPDGLPGLSTDVYTSTETATFSTTGSGTINLGNRINIRDIRFGSGAGDSNAFIIGDANDTLNLSNSTTPGTNGMALMGTGVTNTQQIGVAGTTIKLSSTASSQYWFNNNSTTSAAKLDIAGNITTAATTGTSTLTLTGSNGGTVSGTITNGTAGLALTKAGSGTWTLTAANGYTGTTTISGGTLALSGGNNRLATTGSVTFTGTSTLEIGSTNQTLATISATTAASTATVTGTGILTATNINVVGVVGTASTNTLQLGASGSSLTVNATNMVVAQQATGATGGVTNTGIVNLIGNTNATIGTLTLANNSRTSAASTPGNAAGSLTMGTGTLNATNIIIGQDTAGGTYSVASTTAGTFTTGSGTVKVSTLTMGDKRTVGGLMTVNSTFNLDNGGILQAGTIANGTNANTRVTRDFNWNDGTIQNYDSGTNLTISSATTGATALKIKLAATGTHTFDISPGRTGTVSAALEDATSGGTLAKAGTGTLILTAANTFTGATTIKAGTLALSGSGSIASANITVGDTGSTGAALDVTAISGGTFTLASTQALGGIGTVNAAGKNMTVAGSIAPGNSAGLLSVSTNTLQFGATSALNIEMTRGVTPGAGSNYDQLGLTGSLDIVSGASLSLTALGTGSWTLGNIYFLIANDGLPADAITGEFSGYTEGGQISFDGQMFAVTYDADSVGNTFTGGNDFALMAVPEPGPAALIGGFGFLMLLRRRRTR